jgi:hypothetical protein
VVWHQADTKDSHGVALLSSSKQRQKGRIVSIFEEDPTAIVAAIQDMECHTRWRESAFSRRRANLQIGKTEGKPDAGKVKTIKGDSPLFAD